MSVHKRKNSEIYEQTPTTEQEAWDIIIGDLHIKNIHFQNFYDELVALPQQTPIDITMHQRIESTLQDILHFLNDQVLKNNDHPILGVESLKSIATNALLNHWNYTSIPDTDIPTVLSREEHMYTDLLKQTILVCMRIFREIFDVDTLYGVWKYVKHDFRSRTSTMSLWGMCYMMYEPNMIQFEDAREADWEIQSLRALCTQLMGIIIQTRHSTQIDFSNDYNLRTMEVTHPQLRQAFIPFLDHLNTRGGDFTPSDLKDLILNVAAPYIPIYADFRIAYIDTFNDILRFTTRLIKRAKFLDFINYYIIFADLCYKHEQKMNYCFSLLTDFRPNPHP